MSGIDHGLWRRLREFAKSVRLQSVKVGPASLTFDELPPHEDAFAMVSRRIPSTSKRSVDALAISAHNVDEVTLVDRIDADHECEALDLPRLSAGGAGANTAYILASLGYRTAVAGCTGSDADGSFLRRSLHEVGVDITDLDIVSNSESGRTVNLVEEGGRRLLVVHQKANAHFADRFSQSRVIELARQARIVHLSSFVDSRSLEVQEAVAAEARETSLISLTPGALYAKRGLDRLEGLLKNVDVLFLYREQLSTMIGASSVQIDGIGDDPQRMLNAYFAWRKRRRIASPQLVVVKDPMSNPIGLIEQRYLAVGCGSEELERFFYPLELPRSTQIRAVDTTGAGDAGAAGFLAGLLGGASLEGCLDSAFLFASFASREVGARTAFSPMAPASGSGSPSSVAAAKRSGGAASV